MDTYPSEAWDILQNLFKVKRINDHILHFAAEFSSKLNLNNIKQAVNILSDALPLIRCSFDETHTRPIWIDKGYTADDIVAYIPSDLNSDQCAEHFLCQEIDLEEGPQMKIGVIRSKETDTLCILINHMICDAAGFKEVLYTLSSIYNHLEKNTEIHIDSMVNDRSIHQLLKSYSIWNRLKIFCSKGTLSPMSDHKFTFEGCPSNPFIVSQKIPREQFCAIRSYAKAHNASINDVMMTAYFQVLRRRFGQISTLPCTIDLRRFLPNHKANGICNLMTSISCTLRPDIQDDFETILGNVKHNMDVQKTSVNNIKNIALLEKLFTICTYKTVSNLIKKHFSNAPISFTNIGVLDKNRLTFGSNEMTGAFMTGSIKYSPHFQVALSTFDDEATLSINLRGTQNDRSKITAFLNDMISELLKNTLQKF